MIALFPSRTVALDLFGFGIHWYGIMYLLSFVSAYLLLPRLERYRGLSVARKDWSDVLTAGVLGVIVGGRLGYVLLYDPAYFLAHPLEVFAVWNGGMSSHGGFVGTALALAWVLRRKGIPLCAFADIAVVPVAIGLALGRIGNFINLELYGTPTDLPWGIAIPGVEGLRHPVQFYASAKDLFIALVCFLHLRSVRSATTPGITCALFLMLYGALRFLVEFARAQDYAGLDLGFMELTRGQALTAPVFVVGVFLWRRAGRGR